MVNFYCELKILIRYAFPIPTHPYPIYKSNVYKKRLVPDAEARLYEDLQWAGLQWDEGPEVGGPYGPYRQSERTEIYQNHARKLLDEGSAYRCFCTPQSSHAAEQTTYVTSDCYQNCASLSADQSQERAEHGREAFTIRLRPPDNLTKRIYPDLVYGKIQRLKRSPTTPSSDDTTFDASSDTILLKSDGTPTYHFANVIDDHVMQITHVIRGLEWMASTPLHYDIYSAFGWQPPQFAHVGLLVDQNKAKLSKRNQDLALDVRSMRVEHGVLPYSLNNFLALLGWSNPTEKDVMEMEDLVRNFDLKFTRGNTMVRMEKLWFLQKAHVALRCQRAWETKSLQPIRDVVEQITTEVQRQFEDPFINADLFSEVYYSSEHNEPDALTAYCTEVLLADSKSYSDAQQFIQRNRYFFSFNPAEVPAEKEFYNKARTITPQMLQPTVHNLFSEEEEVAQQQDDDDEQAVESTSTSTTPPEAKDPKYLSLHFHALLSHQIWTSILSPQYAGIPFDSPPELLPQNFRSKPHAPEAHVIAPVAEIMARHLHPEGTEEEIEGLVRRFKVFNGALMGFLREKLSAGLPGPSVGVVMAVLGWEECGRRLGVRRLSNGSRGLEGKEEEELDKIAEEIDQETKKGV